MRRSLEKRARRLEEGLKHAQDLARLAPPDLPEPEELDEMEESERERLEAMLEAITLTGNAEQVREEVQELLALATQAQTVEDAGVEAKLSSLKSVLQEQGFFDHRDQRLLLFTEFKDTLDYLVKRLKSWGFSVGCIHGGMKSGSRDEPGSRLHAEQQFREGGIQILVATEAAVEHYGGSRGLAAVAATVPAGRLASPADVAGVCLLLASPLAAYVSGAAVRADGGGERPPFLEAARGERGG